MLLSRDCDVELSLTTVLLYAVLQVICCALFNVTFHNVFLYTSL